MKRRILARSSNIATRQRVYRVNDGLEVDEVDHYEVHRSRVLYEDVILVTYHRTRGRWFLIVTGVLALMFTATSMAVALSDTTAALIVGAITALPFILLFLLRLIFGIDEVNVYSRRSRARLRFWFRKDRAQQLFEEITSAVRRRQDAMARSSVASA